MKDNADIPLSPDVTYFAETDFRDVRKTFGIKRADRRQHMYVLGKSGTGKSAMLKNMVLQNMMNGEGVCVVDPHGELVEELIELVPEHRINDVVYFNPADTENHMGFNILELEDVEYKHLVASGLMGIFTKIWANVWSSRMEYILNNALLALIDTPGSTLLGVTRILVDKGYREKIVANVEDPVVRSFWINEYEAWQDRFRNEAIAPIQNKVGQFLSTPIIRNIVGQSKSTVNIFDVMNQQKIFLVNVSKGRIGEDNSRLLGGMLITKIQLAAMERVRIPENERKDFYLYVDEFQNFATESFASILSEARKYRLCLILAHQYTAQLVSDTSTSVRDAVFGNVGTMVVFRIGATDAEFLQQEFEPEFMPQDFVMLPNYHIYLKLMVDGVTTRPFSAKTLPPMKVPTAADVVEKIKKRSVELYTRPRSEVESSISEWSTQIDAGGSEGDGKFEAQCSICGKDVRVPFEPKKNLPVYCKEHLEKVKSGEIPPARIVPPPKRERERVDQQVLADLGIEFGSPGDSSKRGGRSKKNDNRRKDRPQRNTNGNHRADPTPKSGTTKDREGLKEILQEALGASVGKSSDHVKEVVASSRKKETVQPMSLKSLARPERPSFDTKKKHRSDKDASSESKAALSDILARAMTGGEEKPEAESKKESSVAEASKEETFSPKPQQAISSTSVPLPPRNVVREENLKRELEGVKQLHNEDRKNFDSQKKQLIEERDQARAETETVKKEKSAIERAREELERRKQEGASMSTTKPQQIPEDVLREVLQGEE